MDSGKPRQNKNLLPCLVATVVTLLLAGLSGAPGLAAAQGCLSPQSLVATRDGKRLFIGCATTNLVLEMELARRTVTDSVRVPGPVSDLALSPDERVLVVTCPGPPGRVCRVTLNATGKTIQRLSSEGQAGHTAGPVAVGLDGKHLFVCHRFEASISDIDLGTGQEVRRIDVRREPVAVAEAGDGKYLLVASLLEDIRVRSIPMTFLGVTVKQIAQRPAKESHESKGLAGVLKKLGQAVHSAWRGSPRRSNSQLIHESWSRFSKSSR